MEALLDLSGMARGSKFPYAARSQGRTVTRLLHAIPAALSVALVAGDARADMLTGSYSGFVFATPVLGRQYDNGSFFGLGANANLGGLPISGTFSYNPACTNYFGVKDIITATIQSVTVSSGTQLSELSLAASSLAGLGTEFSLGAVSNVVDIGIVVRTFTGQFSINPLDPNSPKFFVSNPDEFIGDVFFTDRTLNSGFNFTCAQTDCP
jgi:hypothetical protein